MLFAATSPLASARTFTRYALAVQYHGGNSLGFAYQGPRGENCIIYKDQEVQADLRGIESVEGRIRRALDQLVGNDNYTNMKVSSRTDSGVHAWRNTFQVDIRPRLHAGEIIQPKNRNSEPATNRPVTTWCPKNLVNGLNFYLSRLSNYPSDERTDTDTDDNENDTNANNNDDTQNLEQSRKSASNSPHLHDQPLNKNICILSSAIAPAPIHNQNWPWDVRKSATRRTYAYRILHSHDVSENDNKSSHSDASIYHCQPFENDRVWRIHQKERKKRTGNREKGGLDLDAMNHAGSHLVGTHDFTSFRGKGCQRYSPIVTLEDVWVGQEKYHGNGVLSGAYKRKMEEEKEDAKENDGFSHSQWYLSSLHTPKALDLITIVITGKSFVYHQVRNIVACLVDVGRGKLKPNDVKEILEKRDRSCAPGMAPAKGLFLVDVEHGDFRF